MLQVSDQAQTHFWFPYFNSSDRPIGIAYRLVDALVCSLQCSRAKGSWPVAVMCCTRQNALCPLMFKPSRDGIEQFQVGHHFGESLDGDGSRWLSRPLTSL